MLRVTRYILLMSFFAFGFYSCGANNYWEKTKHAASKITEKVKEVVFGPAQKIKEAENSALNMAKLIKKISELINKFRKVDYNITVREWNIPNGKLRYDQTSFLSAHNSFSAHNYGYTFYYQQVYKVEKLLEIGVRGFLLDLWPTEPDTNVTIKKGERPVVLRLCHGKCDIGPILRLNPFLKNLKSVLSEFKSVLTSSNDDGVKGKLNSLLKDPIINATKKVTTIKVSEYLNKIKVFLDNNPEEVVYFELENYADTESTINAIKESGISNITLKPSDWNVEENHGWPTLGWMRENNKRAVFFDLSENELCYDWRLVRQGMYGSTEIETALKERKDTRNISEEIYLSSINLFPGEKLEKAGGYAEKALEAIKKKNISVAIEFLDKAADKAVEYWEEDYEELNSIKLQKLLNLIIKNGFDTGRLIGKFPNFLSLDQVHKGGIKGGPIYCANFFNDFSAKKLENNNIILLEVGKTAETKNSDLSAIYLAKRIFVEDFSGSNLSNSNLSQAKFSGSGFTKTNLKNSNCFGAIFEDINFEETNFEGADVSGATFVNCDFRKAKSLVLNKAAKIKDCKLDGLNIRTQDLVKTELDNNSGILNNLV